MLRSVVAVVAMVILSACVDAPSTLPPATALAKAQGDATSAVVAMATQHAARVTATAEAIAFNATSTAIEQERRVMVTQDYHAYLMTQISITETYAILRQSGMTLDKAASLGTATQLLAPAAAAHQLAIWKDDEEARRLKNEQQSKHDGLFVISFSVVGVLLAGLLVGLLLAHFAPIREQHRHNCEMNRQDERRAQIENDLREYPEAEPEPDETQADILRQQWQTRLRLFLQAGDTRGFASRDLIPSVISKPSNWELMTDFMVYHRILVKGKAGTFWAAGMDLARALEAAKALPCPDFALFDVRFAGNGNTQTQRVTPETAVGG